MVKVSAVDELERLEARARAFVHQNKKLAACKVFIKAQYSTAYALAQVNRMFAELPAGEAVDVPTVKSIPPHATLLQDLQSVAMGEIEDSPVANIAMSALNLIRLLKSEHASALARAQAAEEEVARLRLQVEKLETTVKDLAGIARGDWTEGTHDKP